MKPSLPWTKTLISGVRSVEPGSSWVAPSSIICFMNETASWDSGVSIVSSELSPHDPPAPNVQIEVSACASSLPSGMP